MTEVNSEQKIANSEQRTANGLRRFITISIIDLPYLEDQFQIIGALDHTLFTIHYSL